MCYNNAVCIFYSKHDKALTITLGEDAHEFCKGICRFQRPKFGAANDKTTNIKKRLLRKRGEMT